MIARNGIIDKQVTLDKMADISLELEQELAKSEEERSNERIMKLSYAQMVEGLKLNTARPFNRRFSY